MSHLHAISGCDDAARRADVVFVHGLGGDAFGTWRHGKDESTSWPHWLGREFPEVGVWSLGYAASPTKWTRFFTRARDAGYSMALPERALEALDLMVQKGLGQRPLLFVCHSLGGLLVKHIVRKADDQAAGSRMHQVAVNTRAILFLATPHGGAALASLIDAFQGVFGATVSIEDLRAHDAHLIDLYDWYRHNAGSLDIKTKTYYERRAVSGVLTIVNPISAQCGVGDDAVALDEDHLSIAKPRDSDAHVCGAVRTLLREHVLVPRAAKPAESTASPAATPIEQRVIVQVDTAPKDDRQRVPCELPPRAENHFGRQTELRQLTERLRAGKKSAVVGPAGLGKTALAAEAVRAVVGETEESLAASPFPDGVVLLDLYTYRGRAEPAWNNLANALGGPGFMEKTPAHERATEACRARRALIIIEGGEEADDIKELCSVFSPQNRRLLLTRTSDQAVPSETVELKEALHPDDAAALLDSLTQERVTGNVRERVLSLLEGHPLALTWAGNLLARDDDDPARLAGDWESGGLPKLSDPTEAEHTLQWLFTRSVRGLDDVARQVLSAAGLLARAPFPFVAMAAALGDQSANARDALKALVRRGLLQRSGEADQWQFTHVLGYRFARQETGAEGAMRERLAHWLTDDLKKALASFNLENARSSGRLLEHAAALLRTDEDQRLWNSMANSLLYDVRDRLSELGRLDLVKTSITGVADWISGFPAAKIRQPEWARERSVLLNRQGDVLRDQGDLAGALAAFRESLVAIRRLAEGDPSETLWQRDLSVSHSKVGDVLRDQGDLAGALTAYRESLDLTRRLSEADLSNAVWQRDLSVCHERIGVVLLEQGDLPGASAAYRESLDVRLRLAEVDPSNSVWQRDLSVSHDRIGDVRRTQGDLAAALEAYRESLALRRRLAEADPSNAIWQRDLSVSLTIMAVLLEQQDQPREALPFAEESLAIDERLSTLDPTNATWQKDVEISGALVARLREQLVKR